MPQTVEWQGSRRLCDGLVHDQGLRRGLELELPGRPRGELPQFPYIKDADIFKAASFDRVTKIWTAAKLRAEFSGGNGIEGIHTIQWYYKNSSVPGPSFILDNHRPIDGATDWTLNRDDYGNVSGDPFHGVAGNGDTEVFYVITPYDSEGNAGDPMVSASIKDNIQ